MRSIRTQIYLTDDQRKRLDARGRLEERSMASLVREAIDHYLNEGPLDPSEALLNTFGTLPDLEAPPREEWDRNGG